MDKRIRKLLRANEKLDMWQVKGQALSPSWTKKWDGGKEKEQKEIGIKRESFRERDSTFSLNFPTIKPAVSGGARGRVQPHGKGFSLRPELGSFEKNSKR